MGDEQAKLSTLIRGLMEGVAGSTAVAGQQYLYALNTYCHTEGDKTVPDCVRIEVSPGHVMDVPLLVLLRLPSFSLDEVEIDLSIKLTKPEIKDALNESLGSGGPQKVSYSIEACPRGGNGSRQSDHVNLRLKFTGHEQTEGYTRALDAIMESMLVVKTESAPERRVITMGPQGEDHDPTSSSSD